jgi:energy-coupling factor transporter transmembrane protein EcfT
MELTSAGFTVLLFASSIGLIISISIFCIALMLLIIKRKKINFILKFILMILAIIFFAFICFNVYFVIAFGKNHQTTIQIEDMEVTDNVLKFNGVYYCEEQDYTNYFRFYQNLTVIGLTGIGKYNKTILQNWSYENYDDFIGEYAISNNNITFSLNSGNDVIVCSGIINDLNIVLNSHSIINGNDENNKVYLFQGLEN